MTTRELTIGSMKVVEVMGDEIVIQTTQDLLDLMGNYPAEGYIFRVSQLPVDFFDLSTKKLGEVLQKAANYHVQVAIVGDFEQFPSKTLPEFIYESNRFGRCLFVSAVEEVKQKWGETTIDTTM